MAAPQQQFQQQLQLALEHHRAGRLREAAALYAALLARDARQIDVLHLLGLVCHQLGKLDEAARLIGRAVALKPDFAVAQCNLGHVLRRRGNLDDAAAAYDRTIALQPDLIDALDGLAAVRRSQGRLDEAIACYHRVLALRPDLPETEVNLGIALNTLGRLDEAIAAFGQVIERHPDLPEVHNNLGCALRDQGRFEPALASFRRALALRPRYERAHTNLIGTMDWAPGTTVAEAQAERHRWYLANRRTGDARFTTWPNVPDPARRLRLGYVSADFRRHSAAFAFGPVLWGHDHSRFEIVCYSGVAQGDDMTERFRAGADLWRPIAGLSDDEVARQIRADVVDVLIDLSGHTVGNRLAVFTAKPAPVQVTAWGSITGTGIPEIDALFADAIMIPTDERSLFAETVVDLPSMLTYQAPDYAPPVGPLPALAAGYMTFGSLNRFAKATDESLAMWARILGECPGSRLLLKDKVFANEGERAHTLARLAGLGVAEDRLIFQGGTDHRGHLAAYGAVDIALDPYPQNGGISTLEALWMGVPVITRLGTMPPGRVGGALMAALGMPDLAARDADGYVAIARRLAADPAGLAERRAGLRARILASPVGDVAHYVAAVEAAYRDLWHGWCATRGAVAPEPPETRRQLERALHHHEAGRLDDAMTLYRQVLEREPSNFDALHLLGVAHRKLGRLADAERYIAAAIAVAPQFATAHNNLGNVLRDLGRHTDAERAYRRAIEIEPADAGAHANLGNSLAEQLRIGEAGTVLRQALALQPNAADAHNAYGVVLWRQGKLDEAIQSFSRAIELRPRDAKAHNNLGLTLFDRGDSDRSIASYRNALAIAPDYAAAHSNLIFTMDSMPQFTIADVQAERQRWYDAHRRAGVAAGWPNQPDPDRRLRVGYVSGDFCRHSAAFCFGPVLWGHDRAAFEVICYSNGIEQDDFTQRFRDAADGWRVTGHLSDEALERMIRDDAIDLLVDLSGHTSSNRLTVFTAKPAPVQLTAWGNVSGTGIPEIDYLLADPIVVPEAERPLFAEQIIDLPCALSHPMPEEMPELNGLPAAAGPVTFGCLNRFSKVSDDALALWARILGECPGSRLLLKDRVFSDPGHRERVLERLAGFDIARDRVIIRGATDRRAHLATYREVDLALDPFPQNGGITSLEGLWMGVPAVTRLGATVAGRITASILSTLGMPELIAHSDDDYVALARGCATHLDGLAAIRAGLRARLTASPLGNAALYVAAVERAYRDAWRRWCASR